MTIPSDAVIRQLGLYSLWTSAECNGKRLIENVVKETVIVTFKFTIIQAFALGLGKSWITSVLVELMLSMISKT